MADRGKKIAIALGFFGIALELITVLLFSSGRIPKQIAVPLVVAGMFLAFVPLFVVARRRRH